MATAVLDGEIEQLRMLLNEAAQVLWDMQGMLDCVKEGGAMDEIQFPNGIRSAVRLMSFRVDAAVSTIGPRL